jgi:uncharacterized protein (DUF169 family)
MYWQGWSERLKKELRLVGTEPIAVTFAGAVPEGGAPPEGKVSVCQALKRASEGVAVTITADTCGCPGGLVSLGLGQMPAQGKERLVDFLINKEKVYCSRVALHRSQHIVAAPVGMASHVCFTPLAKASALPDLVVFVGRPGSLHDLIGFADYWEGGSLSAELAGPACRTGIAYPVVSGHIGLSLLDFGARRLAGFAEDQLLVAVPFHRMIGILHAFDQGVRRPHDQKPEAIEREIDDLGPVERI